MLKMMLQSIGAMFENIYAVTCGLLMSVLGYFLPIKDIVHLMLLLFVMDVIFGFWAAKKLRKERFSVKIIWSHTIPRMLLSIVLVLGAYMWDDIFDQNLVCTYKIVGWFISGVLLFSITENGYYITDWGIFKKIGKLVQGKIKDKTGLDIDDNKKEVKDGEQ